MPKEHWVKNLRNSGEDQKGEDQKGQYTSNYYEDIRRITEKHFK